MKPITAEADGAIVLRTGRRVRMLVVVNGPTTAESLESALFKMGLVDPVASAPQDWEREKPRDWPKEPMITPCANECPVRVSGIASKHMRLEHNAPIEPGAVFTVFGAWDYGPAPIETTGAAAPATSSSAAPATSEKSGGGKFVAAAVVAGVVIGGYSLMRRRERLETETEKATGVAAKAAKEELLGRVQHYLEKGDSPWEAREHAEEDLARRDLRRSTLEALAEGEA